MHFLLSQLVKTLLEILGIQRRKRLALSTRGSLSSRWSSALALVTNKIYDVFLNDVD